MMRSTLWIVVWFCVATHAAPQFEWPTAPVAVADSTLGAHITLKGFTDFPDSSGIHTTAPFSLCRLDADDKPEILVKTYVDGQPGKGVPVTLYAYDDDGTLLWKRSMGEGTCAYGAWSPVIAFDLNGDGLDEIYSYYFPAGGDCRLLKLDPTDGSVVDSALWPGGDRISPCLLKYRASLLIAYLDGINPSIVAVTGYETAGTGHYLNAYDSSLNILHSFARTDSGFEHGSHQYIAADLVGNDGKDEILMGSWYLNHDFTVGRKIELSGHNHCDGLQVSDFDPDHGGYEVWFGSDGAPFTGLMDSTLTFLWHAAHSQQGQAVHGDLVPSQPGWETAYDCCGNHTDPPGVTRRIRYADGTEKTFAELGLDELSIEHHNMQSDFPHWNSDYSVRLLEDIPGLLADLDNQVLCRIKGDFFGDGREEVVALDGNVLKIFAAAGSAVPRDVNFRDDRKYVAELARGSRHFSAFHYTAPLPLRYLPALGDATSTHRPTARDREARGVDIRADSRGGRLTLTALNRDRRAVGYGVYDGRGRCIHRSEVGTGSRTSATITATRGIYIVSVDGAPVYRLPAVR